jgi:hypothetical protein
MIPRYVLSCCFLFVVTAVTSGTRANRSTPNYPGWCENAGR